MGSTALAEHLSVPELGAAISDFETLALDVITSQEGRLVKLIGDEAMFVVSDAARACEIGLALAECVATHPVLPLLRVGMGTGKVLSRDGDYYGPVVNLAARAREVASPGGVVVSAELRADLELDLRGVYSFEDCGRQELRGFEAPVHLHAVTRSASEKS